jgi:hypothetical protein
MRFLLPSLSLTVIAALALASPAAAQKPPPSAADVHFRAGREAAKRGDYVTACAELRASEELDPAPGTLLNLGDCEEHLGHRVRAYELFTQARAALSDADPRAKIVQERVAVAASWIAHVTARLASDAPTGSRIEREGREVASGREIALEPGSYTFDVIAPGRPTRAVKVDLRAGESKAMTLAVADAPLASTRAAPPPPAPAPEPSGGGRTAGWIVGGIGVAGIVTGAVTGILVGVDASTYKQHCPAGSCDPDGLSAMSRGKTLQVVSPIALGVGVACTAAGAYLLLTERTQVGLGGAPDGASFVMRRTF